MEFERHHCAQQSNTNTCTLTHTHTHTQELKLAALLGKTLLEKNTELEKKLRRLQEFAEETLAVKNVCSFTLLLCVLYNIFLNGLHNINDQLVCVDGLSAEAFKGYVHVSC